METIYKTSERKSEWDKFSRYWNEYRQENDTIYKFAMSKTKMPEKINDSRWPIHSTEKESWKIGDPDLPDWLNNYIRFPIDAQLEQITTSGYDYFIFDKANYIVFKEKNIEIYLKKLLTYEKRDITRLVKAFYGKKRISAHLINCFKSDWKQGNVNYQSLLKAEHTTEIPQNNNRVHQEKNKTLDTQKYDQIKIALDRLIDRLRAVIPQMNTDAANEINDLIATITSSEIANDSYAIFHRKASKILLPHNIVF